jgi:glycosyltransferase involved in cell wall biosynthesis
LISEECKISVVIPTYNEGKFIAKMIESLLSQDIKQERLEVLIVDGNSEDETREIVEQYAEKHPWIQLLNNPYKVVPHAMNIGIKASSGEVIVRMDAHSRYPNNYISTLVNTLCERNVDNVGGAWKTVPGADTDLALAIALATSHPFGIGNAEYRLESEEIQEVDTVPYGCYPRDLFDRIGYYDEDLVRNQDDELNARLIAKGGKILLIPSLKITYSARPEWGKMMKMFYQYGFYKPLVNKKLGHAATWRQFIPPIFVAMIILGVLLCMYSKVFLPFFGLGALIYFAGAYLVSFKVMMKEKKAMLILLLPITFFLIHLSYGWGYLRGVVQFMILGKNKTMVSSSR